MRKLVLLLCSIGLVPGISAAQQSDPHLATPRIAAIAQRSTFLHGYLHGYEEGFHQGDFDLQMGRIERGDDVTRGAALKGYQRQFGPKAMFATGYRQGFAVGYADAAEGRRFRAFDNVIRAAANEPAQTASGVGFDEGIRLGYTAGQHQGLADARREAQSQPSPACPAKSTNPGGEFCAAFVSGYEIGYSDGFTNQAKMTQMAEK